MRKTRFSGALAACGAWVIVAACSGSDGGNGNDGTNGRDGANGEAGIDGSQAEGGSITPTAGVVFPGHGFLERELDVQVQGDATHFDGTTTVDFGTGIAVSDVHVESPTALGMHVTIAKDAPIGSHDVTVTMGGALLVSHGAFEVRPELDVVPYFTRRLRQGGVGFLDIHNSDFEHPFYGGYPNGMQLETPVTLLPYDVNAASTNGLSFLPGFFVDPLASSAPMQIHAFEPDLSVYPDGGIRPYVNYWSAPNGLTIEPVTPTTLTSGTKLLAETVNTGYDSRLYSLGATGAAYVTFHVHPSVNPDQFGPAVLALLPGASSSQLLDAAQAFDPFATVQDDPIVGIFQTSGGAFSAYLDVVGVGGGGGTYDVDPLVTSVASATVESAALHASRGAAQALALPSVVSGTLEADGTGSLIDFYSFVTTTDAQEVVVTFNGQKPFWDYWTYAAFCDDASCTAPEKSLHAEFAQNQDFHSAWPALTQTRVFHAGKAGTYYIEVYSNEPTGYDNVTTYSFAMR